MRVLSRLPFLGKNPHACARVAIGPLRGKREQETGIPRLYTRTSQLVSCLVNGGFQLDFGVEKASHVSNGWAKWRISFKDWRTRKLSAWRFGSRLQPELCLAVESSMCFYLLCLCFFWCVCVCFFKGKKRHQEKRRCQLGQGRTYSTVPWQTLGMPKPISS